MKVVTLSQSSIFFRNSIFNSTRALVRASVITGGLLAAVHYGGERLSEIKNEEGGQPSWRQVALRIAIGTGITFAVFGALISTSAMSALAGSLGGLVCSALAATPSNTSFVTGVFSLCSLLCSAVGWGGMIGWGIEPLVPDEWIHPDDPRYVSLPY